LSQALRFLRQSLGSEALITRGPDEVGVDSARLWCDASAFRDAMHRGRSADAMQHYTGEFLDGFFAEEATGFAQWVELERGALRELGARGARQLAELHETNGDLTVAVAWGRRMVDYAPDDERAFRRLLGLLDRAGDRAGALQAYDAFARRLREEYSTEPATETRAMADAIRREATSRPIAVATTPDRPAFSPEFPPAGTDSPPLGGDPLGAGVSLADGRYIIERVLGLGGMATVYLARDVRHQRQVAI